jgi:hypothetical protein
MSRHEVKLVCEERAYAQVLASLRQLPTVLHPQYPARVVQSIYLDTHEGDALDDNLAGISDRQKLRVRWYGDEVTVVHAHLENKRRSNGFGDKAECPLPAPLQVAGASRLDFVAAVRRQLGPAWRWALDRREPVQWIRYRRDYLASADGRVRVTIDRDLAAFDQRAAFVLTDAHPTPLPRILVLEVKAPTAEHGAIERVLQGIAMPVGKCSKFVLASAPEHGPLVSRFGA